MPVQNIYWSARTGNLDDIRRMAADGVDVNSPDTFHSTALCYAIAHKHIEAVMLLLELGADPAIQNKDGSTALHGAIEHKLPVVVEALLKQCPQAIGISNKHGNQPLWTAVFNARGNYEIVRMLLHCGADVDHRNNVNRTPIDCAKSDPALVHLLEAHRDPGA